MRVLKERLVEKKIIGVKAKFTWRVKYTISTIKLSFKIIEVENLNEKKRKKGAQKSGQPVWRFRSHIFL